MGPGGQGVEQAIEAAVGQVAAQHQPQARRSRRHRGRADRDPQQAGLLQMALQVEGQGVIAHVQRQDRTLAGRAPPTRGLEAIPPAPGPPQQGGALAGIGLEQLQGRLGRGRQWRRQGGGVAEGAGALQQPVAHGAIGGEEGPAGAEGLAEGAADQAHPRQAPGQAAATGAEQPEGVGFIHQQQGAELLAGRGDAGQVGAGALHAEQAFAHHQPAPVRLAAGPALQQAAQVGEIVVAKAAQAGAAGLDPHQQGVVDQPVGDHLAVAVGQGQHRGQVGLKAAGEEQHPLAPQPLGEGRLEADVAGARAAHQP